MTARTAHAMTASPPLLPEQEPARPASSVLADRLAAQIATHPPGWRLPRLSELTRRHSVSQAQIEAAIADLARRRLIRQQADGQFYRASPAEYLITFEDLPGLGAHIDPMGAFIERAERRLSRRPVPDDIRRALQLAPGTPACAVQSAWTIDTSPAALSTTYLPGHLGDLLTSDAEGPSGDGAVLDPAPSADPADIPAGRPGAVYLEIQPPPHGIARRLHLREGEPAVTVSVMFTHPSSGLPVALTVAVLRTELFRISIESSPAAPHDAPAARWAQAVQDRELP
jgi:DNA-binding GntR family transcriptional regulator